MDREIRVHSPGEQLGAAEIDADDASLGHAGHITRSSPMADEEDDRPYTTYRARPRFLQGKDGDLDPREGDGDGARPEYEVHGRRRRFDPRRLLPTRRGAGTRGAASRSAASSSTSRSPP